jgi:hypothetical protein
MWNLPVGSPFMQRKRDLGGEMSKLGEQILLNDAKVREAERRLGLQHTLQGYNVRSGIIGGHKTFYAGSITSVRSCDEKLREAIAVARSGRALAEPESRARLGAAALPPTVRANVSEKYANS